MKTSKLASVYPFGQLPCIQIPGGGTMLTMLFDPEMLTIYTLSVISGAMFFYVATREPRI